MKKKIFCIIAVAMILAMTLTFTISAYSGTAWDAFNEWSWTWAYVHGSESDDPYRVGLQEPLFPLLYQTYIDSNDNAERVYMLDFVTLLDVQYQSYAMGQNEYSGKVLDSTNGNYRPNALNFAYKANQLLRDRGEYDFRPYEPKHKAEYDSVMVYFYVSKADGTEPGVASVAMVNSSVAMETGAIVRKCLQFNNEGEYKVTTRIVFTDDIEHTSCEIERTINIIVGTFTEEEEDHYQYGYDCGYIDGYNVGYHKGVEAGEEWSFLGLINAIAKAPFTFIDSAFNFTIFGINVANGIHTIFTLCIIGLVVYAVIKLII